MRRAWVRCRDIASCREFCAGCPGSRRRPARFRAEGLGRVGPTPSSVNATGAWAGDEARSGPLVLADSAPPAERFYVLFVAIRSTSSAMTSSVDGRAGSDTSISCARGGGARSRSCSGNRAVALQPCRQAPDEGGEDGPVGPVQAWSWVGTAEHGDLMPQHEHLDVLGRGGAAQQQDQSSMCWKI